MGSYEWHQALFAHPARSIPRGSTCLTTEWHNARQFAIKVPYFSGLVHAVVHNTNLK